MRVCGPRLQHFFQMWPAVQKVCPPLIYSILKTTENFLNRYTEKQFYGNENFQQLILILYAYSQALCANIFFAQADHFIHYGIV